MAIKNVIKHLILICVCVGFSISSNSQNIKYLLFDSRKDTILTELNERQFYKIDKSLFDISRYNEIDTICKNRIPKTSYTTVELLWKNGKRISDSIFQRERKKIKIKLIETNNEIFDTIYVLEKISQSNFKRTRVWWVDY